MDRFHIATPELAAPYFDELLRRLKQQWPSIQPVDLSGNAVPLPLVALASSSRVLAGGLVFIAARSPRGEAGDAAAVWINGVLVVPEHRRQGVGTLLIQAARRAADAAGIINLYALTELPGLYEPLGWATLDVDGVNHVMVSDGRG